MAAELAEPTKVLEVTPKPRLVISVVTIVRNAAGSIENTLKSVLSQSYPFIEYIVQDGTSTDGTIDIIRKYLEGIAHFCSEPDRGIADAFNRALRKAGGDAVIFLNAGDVFDSSETLMKMIEAIPQDVNPRRSVVYGDAVVVYRGGSRTVVGDHRQLDTRCSICHQSTLIGIDIQRKHLYDTRLMIKMDYNFWLETRMEYPFYRLPLVVCRYAAGGNSGAARNMVRASIETGVVQLLNMPERRTLREIWRVSASAGKVTLKRRFHAAVGTGLYGALKRLGGRSVLDIPEL